MKQFIDIPSDSENEIHFIGKCINQIIADLRELLNKVKDEINQISSGAAEINKKVENLISQSKKKQKMM